MSAFSPALLDLALAAHLPEGFGGQFCVAFSGGLDSTVLLHALVATRGQHPDWQIRAIHIDHQLQPASHAWAEQCGQVAMKLSVPIAIEQVAIARDDSQGLEAAARAARYAVFRRELQPGEMLLTAHHADDQVETMLLALMRGSGVPGLAAMPYCRLFARGRHVRPLLSFSRVELEQWAREQKLTFIDDPSNVLQRHDRNFLRHEVVPLLRRRWPALARSAERAARHLGEALELLNELAADDLRDCAVERALRIESLQALSAPRRRNVLRFWLRSRGFKAPSTRKLEGLERDLFRTAHDRTPKVAWPGVELHWHRGLLYAESERPAFDAVQYEATWDGVSAFVLPAQLGALFLDQSTLPLGEPLTIRFRRSRETMLLPGRTHRHTLRNLFQEHAVLPWWRDRIPLVYSGRDLLAVGDIAMSARLADAQLRIEWREAPEWRAVGQVSCE